MHLYRRGLPRARRMSQYTMSGARPGERRGRPSHRPAQRKGVAGANRLPLACFGSPTNALLRTGPAPWSCALGNKSSDRELLELREHVRLALFGPNHGTQIVKPILHLGENYVGEALQLVVYQVGV